MAAKRVRVKPWEAAVAVSHPETEQFVTPPRGEYFRDDDPLVLAHGWLFATDEEISAYYDAEAVPESAASGRRSRR